MDLSNRVLLLIVLSVAGAAVAGAVILFSTLPGSEPEESIGSEIEESTGSEPEESISSSVTSSGPTASESQPNVNPTMRAEQPEADAAGLTGIVMAISDVQDIPDSAIPKGLVVVIPIDDFDDFRESLGLPADAGSPAPHEFPIEPDSVPASVEIVSIDPNGEFTSTVSGGAMVCLAETLPGDDGLPPFYVTGGCAEKPPGLDSIVIASQGQIWVTAR